MAAMLDRCTRSGSRARRLWRRTIEWRALWVGATHSGWSSSSVRDKWARVAAAVGVDN